MLDPHQMVLSSVPDKLLIMTYLHQIKQYFTTKKKTAEDPDDDDDVTLDTIVEMEGSLRLNTEILINETKSSDFMKFKDCKGSDIKTDSPKDVKTDISKDNETDTLEEGKIEYKANPGYNPFDEDEPIAQEAINIGFTPKSLEEGDVSTEFGAAVDSKEKNDSAVVIRDEEHIKSSKKHEVNSGKTIDKCKRERLRENKAKENEGRTREVNQKTGVKKSSVRSQEGKESRSEDPWRLGTNDSGAKNHAKTKEKAPRPPEERDITDDKSKQENTLQYSPQPGFNPFDEEVDEDLSADKLKTEDGNSNKPKSLNPFDDDYIDEVEESNKTQKEEPKSLNPFDEDYVEPFEADLGQVSENNEVKTGEERTNSSRVQKDNSLGVTKDKYADRTDNMRSSTSRKVQNDRTSPTTVDTSQTKSLPSRYTENVQVTQMHRKEIRRPGERAGPVEQPSALSAKVCTLIYCIRGSIE